MITGISGHSISSPSGVQSALEAHHPGDHVTISWMDQAGQTQTATVVLTAGPAA